MDAEEARQAGDWMRGLGRGDPMRAYARRWLDGRTIPTDAVDLALHRLQAPDRFPWRSVALGVALLADADLSPRQRETALVALRKLALGTAHMGRRRAAGRGLQWGFWVTVALGAVAWVCLGWESIPVSDITWYGNSAMAFVYGLLALVALPGGVVFSAALDAVAADRLRPVALAALGRMGDLASVDVIAAGCCGANAETERSAAKALARVLPALAACPASAIPPRAVPELCRVLTLAAPFPGSPAVHALAGLAHPILDALERIGDGRAVRAVSRVARECRRPGLMQRAAAVLPVLEARRAQEDDAARLLRPADLPAADTLLRPAIGTEEVPRERLLRPARDPGRQE